MSYPSSGCWLGCVTELRGLAPCPEPGAASQLFRVHSRLPRSSQFTQPRHVAVRQECHCRNRRLHSADMGAALGSTTWVADGSLSGCWPCAPTPSCCEWRRRVDPLCSAGQWCSAGTRQQLRQRAGSFRAQRQPFRTALRSRPSSAVHDHVRSFLQCHLYRSSEPGLFRAGGRRGRRGIQAVSAVPQLHSGLALADPSACAGTRGFLWDAALDLEGCSPADVSRRRHAAAALPPSPRCRRCWADTLDAAGSSIDVGAAQLLTAGSTAWRFGRMTPASAASLRRDMP
jgi:hypothetical protein